MRKMINQSDMLARLRVTSSFPPLELRVIEPQLANTNVSRPDAYIDVIWEGKSYGFVAELKGTATPKAVRTAIEQACRYAKEVGLRPMVVLPGTVRS